VERPFGVKEMSHQTAIKQRRMTAAIKFDFERFDGRPCEAYHLQLTLLNFYSTRSDESGSSWADHLLDIDIGGPPIEY